MRGNRRWILSFLALVVGSAVLTFAKAQAWFLHPPLYCEDGLFFSFYFDHRGPENVLWFYNGYVSVLPNVVAYLTPIFPAPLAPYLLSGWALAVGAVARSLFALPHFRPLMPSDRARAFVALALVVWPVGDFAVLHSAVYSLWHVLWILLLLCLVPRSSSWRREVPLFLVQALAVCSHPLSVLVVPMLVAAMARRRDRVTLALHGALLGVVALYQWLGVERGALPTLPVKEILHRTAHLAAVRGVAEPLLGAQFVAAQQAAGHTTALYVFAGAVVTALAVVMVRFRRSLGPRLIEAVGWVVYSAVALTLLGVVARGLTMRPEIWEQRYYHLQQLSLVLVGAVVVASVGMALRWTWRMWTPVGAGLAAVCAFLTMKLGYATWAVHPEDSARVGRFLEEVEGAKADASVSNPRRIVYERGHWSLRVTVR